MKQLWSSKNKCIQEDHFPVTWICISLSVVHPELKKPRGDLLMFTFLFSVFLAPGALPGFGWHWWSELFYNCTNHHWGPVHQKHQDPHALCFLLCNSSGQVSDNKASSTWFWPFSSINSHRSEIDNDYSSWLCLEWFRQENIVSSD